MTSDLDQRLAELMRRAQDGDRRAYEELLNQVLKLVRGFVQRRVWQSDWRDEIVQETLLSIHRDRHTYDPERPFRPWMYAIARHRMLDHIATQRRRIEMEIALSSGVGTWSPAEASHGDAGKRGLLGEALEQLSKTQREVIQMLKLEGFSVAEIAKRTGLSASTVKVTAHRGYKKLRALIGEPDR